LTTCFLRNQIEGKPGAEVANAQDEERGVEGIFPADHSGTFRQRNNTEHESKLSDKMHPVRILLSGAEWTGVSYAPKSNLESYSVDGVRYYQGQNRDDVGAAFLGLIFWN